MENSLPESWFEVSLIEVLESLQSGSRPKGGVRGITTGIPSVGGEHLNDDGGFNFENIKFVPFEFAKQMNKGEIKLNDILIVKDGATTGKTSFVNGNFPHEKAFVNEHVFICRPTDKINSKFLFWFLWSQEGKKRILEHFKGAAQGGINTGFAEGTNIPLAPLPEQHRIVAKLDELMEKTERSKKRLEKIPLILKRFRQSVLAAAVSGKLTEEWREKNKIKEEWQILKATEACETVASGSTPKGKPFFEEEEIPYLKVYNIVNQQIDFFYKPQYITRAVHEKELKRCRIYPNDVIINIVGPPLGKIAMIPNDFPEWNMNQAIVVFRPKKILSPKFLYYVLCDGKQIKEIENELRGTVGQSNISLSQCRDFDFPIPSIKEQHEIVRRVESLFAFADKIETRYTKAKAQFDKLPQALLAKAFKGELVEQREEDEPASVLLERIKKEKTTSSAKGINFSLKKGGDFKRKKRKGVEDAV